MIRVLRQIYLLIFTNHLLDFSYNIGVMLGYSVFVCALMKSNENKNDTSKQLCHLVTGVGLAVVFFCKIPVFLILIAAYVCHEYLCFLTYKNFQRSLGNLIAVSLGGLGFFGYVSYSIDGPIQVLNHMYDGYQSLKTLELYSPSIIYEWSKIVVFFDVLMSRMVAHFHGQPQFLFFLVILVAPMAIWFQLNVQKLLCFLASQIFAAALIFFIVNTWLLEVDAKTQLNNLHMGFGLCLILFLILLLSSYKSHSKNQLYLFALLFFGFFINRFLSTNNLYNSSYLYMGLNFSAILLLMIRSHHQTRILSLVPVLFVLVWCVSSSYVYHFNFPYRLSANLAQANEPVNLHENYGSILLPESDAKIYKELSKLNLYTGNLARGDWLFIDLTGRIPGVALAQDAYTGELAWNAGGYPGSGEFMKLGLRNVPKNVVKNTVVVSSQDPRRLNGENHIERKYLNEFLSRHNLAFPEDYIPIGEFHIPYVNYNAKIYVSKELYEGR